MKSDTGKSTREGDPLRPTGGCGQPPFRDRSATEGRLPADDLGLHIAGLLHLHPEINLDFRQADLNRLDEAAKRDLLQDINRALGIEPLAI